MSQLVLLIKNLKYVYAHCTMIGRVSISRGISLIFTGFCFRHLFFVHYCWCYHICKTAENKMLVRTTFWVSVCTH